MSDVKKQAYAVHYYYISSEEVAVPSKESVGLVHWQMQISFSSSRIGINETNDLCRGRRTHKQRKASN